MLVVVDGLVVKVEHCKVAKTGNCFRCSRLSSARYSLRELCLAKLSQVEIGREAKVHQVRASFGYPSRRRPGKTHLRSSCARVETNAGMSSSFRVLRNCQKAVTDTHAKADRSMELAPG